MDIIGSINGIYMLKIKNIPGENFLWGLFPQKVGTFIYKEKYIGIIGKEMMPLIEKYIDEESRDFLIDDDWVMVESPTPYRHLVEMTIEISNKR